MNKFYDKLFLALALLALFAGVGFYVMKSGAIVPGKTQISTQTADNPYQQIPVPASVDQEAAWPEAPEQSTNWIYDVFTPPKIFLGPNGEFLAEGVKPPPPPEPFGVYLAEIQRKPYRIQIEGYIEEDLKDSSKSLLLLYDEEQSKSIRARIGREVKKSEFEVLNFSIERKRDGNGNIEKVATATIMDKRSGEEVVLTHGERLFDDGVTVIIRSREDASVSVELAEVGDTFETSLAQYVLKDINLEESAVTVEKLGTETRETQTKQLTAEDSSSANSTESSTPVAPNNNSSESTELDFMFDSL